MSSQFKNKAEALAAIAYMDVRAFRAESWITYGGLPGEATAEELQAQADNYRAEAARITALLPTMPE